MNNTNHSEILEDIKRAVQLANEGRQAEALPIFNYLLGVLPNDLTCRVLFGDLCMKLANATTAVSIFKKIADDYPDNADHLGNLGLAYIGAKRFDLAEAPLKEATEKNKNSWQFFSNFGAVLLKLGKYDEAIEAIRKSIEIKPSVASNYENLIIGLMRAERHKEAIEIGKKAIKKNPGDSKIYSNLGHVLLEAGDEDEAVSCFEKAINLDKLNGDAYLCLSSAKKFTDEDTRLIKRIEKVLEVGMAPLHRSYIHFSLAKMYNDLKKYEAAFAHLQKANTLKKSASINPDISYFKGLLEKVYTPELLKRAAKIGHPSARPVFVLGMPRSGTTLIEQIIGRHSQAAGAGELEEIGTMSRGICSVLDKKNYVNVWKENLSQEKLNELAESYLKVLDRVDASASVVVDKLPDNFMHMGLIFMMFPNARFIHANRDPLDNCLSCYFQCFQHIHWSFDLEWISNRYAFYRDIVGFWKELLPEDRILDVRYEELVEDPETGGRRIVEHCGLEWEPQCLDNKIGGKAVSTASLWQVRQPIYKSSVKRWHPYAAKLGILAKGLAPFLEDEDIEFFQSVGIKVKRKRGWLF